MAQRGNRAIVHVAPLLAIPASRAYFPFRLLPAQLPPPLCYIFPAGPISGPLHPSPKSQPRDVRAGGGQMGWTRSAQQLGWIRWDPMEGELSTAPDRGQHHHLAEGELTTEGKTAAEAAISFSCSYCEAPSDTDLLLLRSSHRRRHVVHLPGGGGRTAKSHGWAALPWKGNRGGDERGEMWGPHAPVAPPPLSPLPSTYGSLPEPSPRANCPGWKAQAPIHPAIHSPGRRSCSSFVEMAKNDSSMVKNNSSGETTKNDDDNGAADIHRIDILADECPPELDPAQWRYYNYTFGLPNMSLTGMILVTLLFIPLAVILLHHLPPSPAPAPSSSPPAATTPEPSPSPAPEWIDTRLQQSVYIVWTVSLLVVSYLSFWTYTLSRTMGATAIFLRVTYAAAGLLGPSRGSAGLMGYALAEYRMDDGGELAAGEAAARAPAASRSEAGEGTTFFDGVFLTVLGTLYLGSGVVWIVFFTPDDDDNGQVSVVYVLSDPLVSSDFMGRLVWYYVAVLVLMGRWFWAYYLGLKMMAMAAFFGYILAVNPKPPFAPALCRRSSSSGEMAKNDGSSGEMADECPSELDPAQWRYYNYTFGLPNMSLTGVILVTLLFIPLAVVLLCRLPHAPSPAPSSAPPPVPKWIGTRLNQSVYIVWTVSLLISSYLSFWTYTLSRTMAATSIFLRVSYAAALAYAAAGFFGPVTGMAFAHLTTAWAAGLLGYALAEYRMDDGGELAADEAAARTPASRSKGEELTLFHSTFMIVLMTLGLASGVVWIVFFPSDDDVGQFLVVYGLSNMIWWILYMWAVLIVRFSLHEALVSTDFMLRLLCYYLAFFVASMLCVLLGPWFFAYYFGLEMMAMAAFFGYILAVNARRKDIMAR
nr:unnamed protein product [Digitaria exilis]